MYKFNLNSAKKNAPFSLMEASKAALLKEISGVIKSKKSDLEKQKKMESLNSPFLSETKARRYQLNPVGCKLIKQIDQNLSEVSCPESLYKKI
jgi:hypothetical protein